MSVEVKPGYVVTEVGVIPADWKVCQVREMGEVITGKALAANGLGVQRPYLRTKNVFDGRIDIDDVLTMPMTDAQFSQFQLRKGDVLLNEGQSLELVGRCAMYMGEYPEPCAIQNALLRFRARSGVSANFATHLFRHCQKTGVFSRIALQTTSVAHLGGSRFERLRLAWPNSEIEQVNIATALDDMDALISGLDQLIAKKRDIKQAAMQQLLTGKKRLPGFSGEWEVKRLGEVGELISGGTPKTTNPAYWRGEVKWCTPTDITATKGKYLSETERKISDLGLACSGATLLPAWTLLICTRATIGDLKISTVPVCTNQGFKSLVCHAGISYEFMYYKMLTMKQDLVERAFGSTFLEISKANMEVIELSLPPSEEQTAIATILSDMDAELASLEARRDKAKQLKQGMMQELLTGRIRLV